MNRFKLLVAIASILALVPPRVAQSQIAWVLNNDDFAGVTLYENMNCSGTVLGYYGTNNIGYPEHVEEYEQYASSVIVDGSWCVNVPVEYQSELATLTVDVSGNVSFSPATDEDPFEAVTDYSTDGIPDNVFPATAPTGADINFGTGQTCPATIVGVQSNRIYHLQSSTLVHIYAQIKGSVGGTAALSFIFGDLTPSAKAELHAEGIFVGEGNVYIGLYWREGDGIYRNVNCSNMKFL